MKASALSATADLADALMQGAEQAGANSPRVRGADWRQGIVTTVGTDGTVTVDNVIIARRLESYRNPTVGDRIVVTLSSNGNWLAWGRMVKAADAVGDMKVARKTGDTGRTNTNTPTNDPHLTFAVTANATYVMDGWIKYSALADTDLSINWASPTGSLGEWAGFGAGLATTGGSTGGYSIRTEANDVGQARNFSGTTASNELTVMLAGVLRVQGTGGTYAMQWSQGNVGASVTTVYTDSWVRIHRVA